MIAVKNHINHIALVLDASGSMQYLSDQLIKVVDQQVAHLAQRSKEMDQETRVTAYTFGGGGVTNLFYDKDVLRLPSLRGLYDPFGQTPLIDATVKALDDLSQTPELYGDHAFLAYVLTDGQENSSKKSPRDLAVRLQLLKDNWTVACFVPNATGVHEAKQFGFDRENIAVWDTSTRGLAEMGSVIRQTTDSYMTARASGVRGTRSLFTPDVTGLNKRTVSPSAGMQKLGPGQFRMFRVDRDTPIAPFIERETRRPYVLGEAFYQLTTKVVVQANKQVAIYDRAAHAVYVGREARQLIGLPDFEIKLNPAMHPSYDIFVQSTSVNRKLLAGTNVLLLSVVR